MNNLNHVAIIMDGNGRWGLKRNQSRNYGHIKGIKTVEKIIKESVRQKIKHLTLYTFSTENWRRPKSEVNFLFNLIRTSLKKRLGSAIKQGIRIKIIGKKKGLPKDIKKSVKNIERKTFQNKRITVNIALNYGSKEEILDAFAALSKTEKKKINITTFEKKLYTKGTPDPEILIRTGGTKRLSNFLLWQLAYTDIFFVNKLWPDFDEADYSKIINKFYNIKRNFGTI